jgi:hypothetical protein
MASAIFLFELLQERIRFGAKMHDLFKNRNEKGRVGNMKAEFTS